MSSSLALSTGARSGSSVFCAVAACGSGGRSSGVGCGAAGSGSRGGRPVSAPAMRSPQIGAGASQGREARRQSMAGERKSSAGSPQAPGRYRRSPGALC